jgi:hypothetical protein
VWVFSGSIRRQTPTISGYGDMFLWFGSGERKIVQEMGFKAIDIRVDRDNPSIRKMDVTEIIAV